MIQGIKIVLLNCFFCYAKNSSYRLYMISSFSSLTFWELFCSFSELMIDVEEYVVMIIIRDFVDTLSIFLYSLSFVSN